VHNLVLASASEGWSYGGSILTFLLPMLAFAAVALALLVLYTKPQVIPGRNGGFGDAPVGATRLPGLPAPAGKPAEASGNGAAASAASAGNPTEAASAE
jgi:hypothetical protein